MSEELAYIIYKMDTLIEITTKEKHKLALIEFERKTCYHYWR